MIVIPAKAGIQIESFCFYIAVGFMCRADALHWIPAFAGMTMLIDAYIFGLKRISSEAVASVIKVRSSKTLTRPSAIRRNAAG